VKAVSFIGVLCVSLSLPCAPSATAEETPIILSIHTEQPKSSPENNGLPLRLTMSDLRALPVASFETTTIWTMGSQVFSGVWLATLLARHGITTGTLELVAINDYRVEIPVNDISPNGALLAYERNGEEMSLRDKGPLWLVYDWDDNPNYRTEIHYSRSIWQLDRIIVKR
jgi:hypothetical protein